MNRILLRLFPFRWIQNVLKYYFHLIFWIQCFEHSVLIFNCLFNVTVHSPELRSLLEEERTRETPRTERRKMAEEQVQEGVLRYERRFREEGSGTHGPGKRCLFLKENEMTVLVWCSPGLAKTLSYLLVGARGSRRRREDVGTQTWYRTGSS